MKNNIKIYEYINSKAIREHMAKFGDIFTPLDKSYLIYQTRQKSVQEKISAMTELLKNSEDFDLKNVRWRFHHTDMTFHELLKEYIETEQYYLDKFFAKETDAVYTYTLSWNGHILEYNEPYTDYQSCFDALTDEIADDRNAEITQIVKRYFKSSHTERTKTITAVFSNDLAFVHSAYAEGMRNKKQHEIYDIFDEMWVDVPTPFKKGDILYGPNPYVMGYGHCEPFVLLDVCNSESKERTNKLKQNGDTSDMTAHGYWQRENGHIYWECMHDYLSLEYYDGDFKGEKRILKALSSFLKGEITEDMLMSIYRIVLGEKELGDLKRHMHFTEEVKRLAGF